MDIPAVVGTVLRTVAPTLLAAISLPPPFSIIAAAAVSGALDHWLPTKAAPPAPGLPPVQAPAAQPQEIVAAVERHAGDPEFILALRKAEIEVQQQEMQLGIRYAELAAKERESSRQFQTQSGIAEPTFKAGMRLVTVALVLLFGVIIGSLALLTGFVQVSYEASQMAAGIFGLVGTAVGFINGIAGQVVSFYWGASQQGAERGDTIAETMRDLGARLGDSAVSRPPPAPAPAPPVVVMPPAAPTPAPPAAPEPPQESRFNLLIGPLLREEGGYVDHPDDPGGATNMGITIGTLRDWRGEDVTKADVQNLTESEARRIYFSRYWNALQCDHLPPGVDQMVFDFGVNAGVRRSATILQECLRKRDATLAVDGIIGPLTLAVVKKVPPMALIEELHSARMAFYRSLRTWPTFGNGWTTRANRVLIEAKATAVLA